MPTKVQTKSCVEMTRDDARVKDLDRLAVRILLANGLIVLAGGLAWGIIDYLFVNGLIGSEVGPVGAMIVALWLLTVVSANWRLFRGRLIPVRLLATTIATFMSAVTVAYVIYQFGIPFHWWIGGTL